MIRRIMIWVLVGMLLCAGAQAEVVPQNPAGMQTEEMTQMLPPTPEEIIVSAMEVYSWFTISPLDVDPELFNAEAGMYRVADEVMCDYATVMGMLMLTFSPEVIDDMLSYEVYSVIDGMLYTLPGGRGIDLNISSVEYEQTYEDEQKIVYTVTVHYLGEVEFGIEPDVFEFVREKIEGLWLFTQFPFFW